ncbi:MAG: Translation initiation factor IF-3 [Phycisphaerae bacterium]|nr:Translation initiation factor IF-3 [Phycisphaerae bacterium]
MVVSVQRVQTREDVIPKGLRTNEQIRISQVRLIGEGDEQVGIVDTSEAMRRAREAGMDLVEVAPNDRPPVCRIMDYGKWKYRQKKKEQKARQQHHAQTTKEVRLRPKTDTHDLEYKLEHAKTFLAEGDRVQFTMLFRGREMAHQDLGRAQMLEIAERLSDMAKVETGSRMAGRRMTMVLIPTKKGGGGTGAKPAAKPKAAEGEAKPAVPAAGPDAAAPAPAPPTPPAGEGATGQ